MRPARDPLRALQRVAPLLALTACVHVESGTDPVPLGYGPGAHASLSAGYDPVPVERPAPTPWNPPASELGFAFDYDPYPSEPSPTEPIPYNDDLVRVCEHLASLDPEANEREDCLRRYRIERVFRPISEWKTLAACVEAASDAAGVAACERKTPRVFGPVAEHPRESEVCMHIFSLTIVEQLGAEPMLERERLAEFEELLHDCVNSLVEDERSDRTPVEYGEMLECMQGSLTTAAAEACE